MWIGKPKIIITKLPKIGDRDDFKIRAIGPGKTDYTFPLSITRTISSIWQVDSVKSAAQALVSSLLRVSGTAKAPPKEGFWFDSYNSEDSLKGTQGKIANQGIFPFTKNVVNQKFVKWFGNDLFSKKEESNIFFKEKYGRELFRSFEDAFEHSQALEDLNSPPKDRAHFLYRICILSVFIDHFNIRNKNENKKTGSLQAFRKWMWKQLGKREGDELIRTFQMIKNLRKQYPIHEEYEIKSNGVRAIRKEVKSAKKYFVLSDDYEDDWNKIMTKFVKSLVKIKDRLKENQQEKQKAKSK